ncbi:FHA domain-containing protein [Streptomyces sp. NPDC058373]|uniref:FHA domain-containing protein n=1 Tax=unclassified Streptomyces TaxID=2593676 RepID=UPI0036639C1A
MPTCPNGHQSDADDWCEVCGHRMAGPGVPPGPGGPGGNVPPPPPPPPAPGYGYPPPGPGHQPGGPGPGGPGGPGPGGPGGPQSGPGGPGGLGGFGGQGASGGQPQLCPQCHTPRVAAEPFCEECRWNFITNTATSYTPAAPRPPAGGPPGGFGTPPQSYDYQGSRPSQMNRPAEPLSPGSQQGPPPVMPSQPGVPTAYPAPPYAGGPAQGPPPPPPATGGGAFPAQAPPGAGRTGAGQDDDWVLPPPSAPAGGPSGPQSSGPQGPAPQRPGASAPATWSVSVGPDRSYFMAMMQRSGPEASGLNLPAYSPEQRHSLVGNQLSIGRRRHSTGDTPDIDLSVPPEDPGVSHQHAMLVKQPDGGWAVVDQNSTNGTTVNGGEEPIQPYVPVPLSDGDRVHVGAWTTVTLHRD